MKPTPFLSFNARHILFFVVAMFFQAFIAANCFALDKTVRIKDKAFSPAILTVPVGTTVVWTNQDTVSHTVTSKNKVLNSPALSPGEKYTYTFDKGGTYSYACTFHPSMKGKVIVKTAGK